MRIIKFIFVLLVMAASTAQAVSMDVYMKNVSRDSYQFYAKLVEPSDRPIVFIHGEVAIPIPIGPETPEHKRTSYLRVWKENNQWKGERFTSSNTARYNDFLKWSRSNKLSSSAYGYYSNGSSISLNIGTYKFGISNYKSSPSVSQTWQGVPSGLIGGHLVYPYSSFVQSDQAIDVESYVTDEGQAALSLQIPYSQSSARLSLVENAYTVEGMAALQADANVSVITGSDLTTINIDHADKVVSYYLKTQSWVDHNSGVKNPNGSGWTKLPYQADYLTAIGQCERLKTAAEPTCFPVVKLDYGRKASLDSFPHLAGWRDSTQSIKHNYQNLGGVMAIVSTDTSTGSAVGTTQSKYSYALNSAGKPVSLSQENIPDANNNTRQVTSYVTHGDYAGLASRVARHGTLDGTEYLLSDTAIEWRIASNGQAQKAKVVESVYAMDGSISQTTTTENYYDAEDRLEKRVNVVENNNGEQVEDQVEYRFENDFVIGKTERRSVVSPAYANGVSEQLVKEFAYVYENDTLVEQVTRQGQYESRDLVKQDDKGRVVSRVKKVNGQIVLDENITYSGENVTKRCENGTCIDYQYQTLSNGRVETSSINGIAYDETHFDDQNRVISKTTRGITKQTEYYKASEVPSRLQEWLGVCPSDTTSVVYYSLPESMVCNTSRGDYHLQRGMDERFVITAEIKADDETKQILLPHFEGEEAITHTVSGSLERQNVEYEVNGQTQERSELTQNLTETYDKWGNVVRRYYDITGLLYQVDDHLGNSIRFTYNAQGKLTSSELNNNPETKVVYKYDERGLRTDTIDPSRGHWKYHYNLNNQLEWQLDANGDRTSFEYDQLNRVTQLTTPYSTVCYEYPHQLPLGEPSRVIKVAGSQQNCSGQAVIYEERNTYKWPHGWLIKREITLEDGNTQTTQYEHDNVGNVTKETTPSRFAEDFSVDVTYKNSIPVKWSNSVTGEVYKEILSQDAQQRATHIRYGNGLEEFYQFDRISGQLAQQSASRNGALVYHFDYEYNTEQQLINRKRHFYYKNRSETSFEDEYTYDDQNRIASHRIKQFCVNGVCQDINVDGYVSAIAEYKYDRYGNITYKTGVGNYYYESSDPYKLTRLEEDNGGTRHFTYDSNGNLLSDGLREFSYENNRLVYVGRVQESQENTVVDRDETRFTYGPDGQQIVRTDKRFDIVTLEWTTQQTFSTGAYSYTQGEGSESQRYESYGGNGFTVSCTESGCETSYSHTDRLGQRIMVTDSEGTITSQTFTDPFGATHNVMLPEMDDAFAISPTYSSVFGHSGVAGFDLIHMKGRVYDPYLARFIQADAFIKGKEVANSYNRYAYKFNNPINTVDPTGYWGFKKIWKKVTRPFQKIAKEISRAESRIRKEAKRIESQIRNEAKRAESNIRNEAKRLESRVRNEAKRVESQIRNESKRFERRVRHEVGRWESDIRQGVKIVGMMVKENPEMVLAMMAAAWAVGPAALSYFSNAIPALLGTAGATAGSLSAVVTNTLIASAVGASTAASTHLIMNKGSLKGIEKSILKGALTGGIAYGVAHGVMGTDFMTNLLGGSEIAFDTVTNVIKSVGFAATDNLIYGKDFSDALLASFLVTTSNSQIAQHLDGASLIAQTFVSAIAGGIITTEIYGGDFAANFASGFLTGYLDYRFNELGGSIFDVDILEALELTMDFIPVVSNLKAGYELATGSTLFGLRELSDTERALLGAAIFLGPAAKATMRAGRIAITAAKHSDETVDMLTASSKVHDATKATDVALESGKVWDSIKATQGTISGTLIPKSFELSVDGGKFWVHPNATKHMVEYLTRNGMSHTDPINNQLMLKSFQVSVNKVITQGYKRDEMIQAGRWEIMVGSGKPGDTLPVIKHALYK